MPHQTIEYSANLDADIDIEELVAALHDTAVAIDALPIGGIRTRAVRRDCYRIADGHPNNTFINVMLRVAPRPPEVKKDAGERLFQALRDFIQPIFDKRPMSLSLEIQDIDPENRWKQSNIRAYLAERANKNH